MTVRVATFNLNNLFDRFNFHAQIPASPRARVSYRWTPDRDRDRDAIPPLVEELDAAADEVDPVVFGTGPVHVELSPMGQLVKQKPNAHFDAIVRRADLAEADVLAVQEVENIAALREFEAALERDYPFLALVEGNDS